MNFSEVLRSGGNYLRGMTQDLFGATKQEGPGTDLEKTLSFPTGKDRKPFEVECQLFKLPQSWGDDAWRILISAKNARHPYDEKCVHGYFGKEIMNPALMTALNEVEQVFAAAPARAIEDLKLQKAVEKSGPQISGNMDGTRVSITLNTDMSTGHA